MAKSGNLKIVKDSLQKARSYTEESNYGRAFAHYLVVFQLLAPNARVKYEKDFTQVLHFWGSLLHKRRQYEDIFKCYQLALTYFPNSAEILNNLGVHTLKLKDFKSAKSYFESSLKVDADFLPAEQNLQTTKYALVERWHFPMLNDVLRNKSFAQALFMEIAHGFTDILDVGTGTGILSLFASKSKQCKSVVACDYSDVMYEIAKQVFEANNVCNVKLIKKNSSQLEIPGDLNQKASLLVTEIVDSGIFGENILETLIHAWENLLNPFPQGKVIPAGVSIYITGIESEEIARKTKLLPRENDILSEICISHSTIPYDTENLKTIKYDEITQTNLCLNVNFNDLSQLKSLNERESKMIGLKCVKSGRIDAFAVWFTLHLNESVDLSNCPKEVETCWEQSIVHLRHPVAAQKGQEINLSLSCIGGCFKVDYFENLHDLCYTVSKDVLYFLNDFLLLDQLKEASVILRNRFKGEISVLDLSPFPYLGLLLAKSGAKLTHRLRDSTVEQILQNICQRCSIDLNRIVSINADDFNDFTSADLTFDVVFQSMISPCGLLCEEDVFQARVMNLSLTPLGVYLPNRVDVWAQLVQCDWLDKATKVHDEFVCGFKIAQFINEYKSTEQRDMNLRTTPHTILSQPINLGSVTDDISSAHLSARQAVAVADGRANAVFYWFELQLLEDGGLLSTNRQGAFVNNAAFMLPNYVPVKVGDVLLFTLKQHKGIMKIFLNHI